MRMHVNAMCLVAVAQIILLPFQKEAT